MINYNITEIKNIQKKINKTHITVNAIYSSNHLESKNEEILAFVCKTREKILYFEVIQKLTTLTLKSLPSNVYTIFTGTAGKGTWVHQYIFFCLRFKNDKQMKNNI